MRACVSALMCMSLCVRERVAIARLYVASLRVVEHPRAQHALQPTRVLLSRLCGQSASDKKVGSR
eukprot:645585-Pleurochrysis_carterae.AAC.1